MSASERFLRSRRLAPLIASVPGSESRVTDLKVATEYGSMRHDFHGLPILIREGERLVLEQTRGRLTLYRALK